MSMRQAAVLVLLIATPAQIASIAPADARGPAGAVTTAGMPAITRERGRAVAALRGRSAPLHGIIFASDEQGNYTALGQGTVSCGDWISRRKGDDWYPLGAWIVGYLTAYNEFVWKGTNIAEQNSPEELYAWMDGYCALHPQSDLAAAAGALLVSLGAGYRGIVLQKQLGT